MAPILENVAREVAVSVGIAAIGLGALTVAYIANYRVLARSTGDKKQTKIAQNIEGGAKAFLKKEYKFLAVFVFAMLFVVGGAQSQLGGDLWWQSGLSFLLGAALSAGCGWTGMLIAVKANVRTTEAATVSLNEGLKVAFASGAVMGLSVVSSGLFGVVLLYGLIGGDSGRGTAYLAGLGFGASSIALFARVGGGIYTKAADVGADLVGKVEASIPEDDPRNPATIADNVGDNVGDVAGMGADLFESFVGSIIAAIQLADTDSDNNTLDPSDPAQLALIHNRMAFPLWVAGFGLICSILGVFLVRVNEKAETSDNDEEIQHSLLAAINRGIHTAAVLSAALSLVAAGLFFDFETAECYRIWGCTIIGLAAGVAIGSATEYCTSFAYKPTKSIAKKSRLGSSAVIIQGLGIGQLSTVFPVVFIFITILATVTLAGLYGIAVAAVGMLATLGVTLATDAFGPVADNAGGIAEMAELPEEIRDRTDALDALGNTTAATGKGFAIGSAVLTALALLSSFVKETNSDNGSTVVDITKAEVIAGAIFGACLPYVFAALTMMAVARAAGVIIEEVRRQFREIKGLLDGSEDVEADHSACVASATQSSLVEMVIPGLLAIVAPLFIGFLLGRDGLTGMLVGGITSGFMLAVSMSNSGGAWDNAKKFVEAEGMGTKADGKAKGSDLHKAVVVGDTVGDPFKDTSGPALNILIKLMSVISLVFAPVFRNRDEYELWWVALIIGVVFMTFVVAFWLTLRARGFGKIAYGEKNTLGGKSNDPEDPEEPAYEEEKDAGETAKNGTVAETEIELEAPVEKEGSVKKRAKKADADDEKESA